MPTSGGMGKALRRGKEIGCEAVQVFTSSPQQWKAREITDEMASDFRTAQVETGIGSDRLISHDSYLVNLCAPDEEIMRKSLAALKSEMDRCAKLGIGYVVSHMGAHMGQGEESGMTRIAEAARQILAETDPSVTLLMETTAGQGSALGVTFEQLAQVLDGVGGDARLGVCLDTCHVFAAGYDIRTPETYAATFGRFDRIVGLDRLKAIHVNDSLKPFGSHRDRHAAIGAGEIGLEAFRLLVNDARLAGIPAILETPDAETMHAVNLQRLRDLIENP